MTAIKALQVQLIAAAREAAAHAHAPYSGFRVGAALLAADGRVFTGCNVENASYGLTLCAERVAICKAVSEGVTNCRALAIAGGEAGAPAPPCGACRQTLAEFFPPSLPVWYAGLDSGPARATTLGRLLPHLFSLKTAPIPRQAIQGRCAGRGCGTSAARPPRSGHARQPTAQA